ncbi:MAG: pyridoxal phosphate-dependent aminotransferase [Acidobacteria bacterium]|nr:pyridoxal phosphate-dependent aminotransferase [Acidobacteriota bacterium]
MSIAARRMSRIKASPAAMISAKAMEMARAGRDVIALSAGEPDFDTPDPIKIAAIRAIVEGKTKYPPLTGIPELREAICRKLERENGLRYAPDQVIVSNGGKQVIYNALAATLDPEDEVVVPAPFWVSYPDMTLLAGGTPVMVAADAANGFRLTAAQLDGAVTARTKWLILNNPGNPSGGVYSARDLEELADVLRRHPRVWVLADDIYEHIIYGGGPFATMAQVAPDLYERTLTMNGLSKAYCMTGWRIGYGAGPKDLIAAMAKVQSQTTSGASSVSQWAGVEALDGDQAFIRDNLAVFEERRDLATAMLDQADGLSCSAPQGAFYLYVACGGGIGKRAAAGGAIDSDGDLARYLLESEEVAVVHGEAFGLSPYFRVSYALATDRLDEACRRIQRACASLSDR